METMESGETSSFENERWPTYKQTLEFRHRTALELISSPQTVLDIGSGDGLLLSLVQEKFPGAHVEGADISLEAIKRCTERGIHATLVESAERLPYADKSFDTVVLLDVLEHTYQPERILKEAARVARIQVIVGVPNFSSLPARLQVLMGEVPENNRPQKGHVYWFNKNALESVANKSGVSIHPKNWHMNVQRPLRAFAPLLLRAWPNLFALSFVVAVEVK